MTKSRTTTPPYVRYLSEDEISKIIVSELSDGDLKALLDTPRGHLIKFHMIVGMHIRNRFGLWEEGNPFTDSSDPMGDAHPDQVSQRIIERVWEHVHARYTIQDQRVVARAVNYDNGSS